LAGREHLFRILAVTWELEFDGDPIGTVGRKDCDIDLLLNAGCRCEAKEPDGPLELNPVVGRQRVRK